MPQKPETIPIDGTCPRCGIPVGAGDSLCPHCGMALGTEDRSAPTGLLSRDPSLWSEGQPEPRRFKADTVAVFQFLPSGTCLSFTLARPVLLGRQPVPSTDEFVDLTPFQADPHGVSRQHCRIWRADEQVLLMDLGSTNGTYLNGERVMPHQIYTVEHDTRLILGSLHLAVTFS